MHIHIAIQKHIVNERIIYFQIFRKRKKAFFSAHLKRIHSLQRTAARQREKIFELLHENTFKRPCLAQNCTLKMSILIFQNRSAFRTNRSSGGKLFQSELKSSDRSSNGITDFYCFSSQTCEGEATAK